MSREVAQELERRIEEMGFELVELDQVGDARHPILRLRVDRPDSTPGSGVTIEECARVSRTLQEYLDQREGQLATYVLEVSSPGVERPLVRTRDWHRFAGQEIAVEGKAVLAGKARRLEGELMGLVDEDEKIALRLPSGEEIEFPRADVTRAHLVYRWGKKGRQS